MSSQLTTSKFVAWQSPCSSLGTEQSGSRRSRWEQLPTDEYWNGFKPHYLLELESLWWPELSQPHVSKIWNQAAVSQFLFMRTRKKNNPLFSYGVVADSTKDKRTLLRYFLWMCLSHSPFTQNCFSLDLELRFNRWVKDKFRKANDAMLTLLCLLE